MLLPHTPVPHTDTNCVDGADMTEDERNEQIGSFFLGREFADRHPVVGGSVLGSGEVLGYSVK